MTNEELRRFLDRLFASSQGSNMGKQTVGSPSSVQGKQGVGLPFPIQKSSGTLKALLSQPKEKSDMTDKILKILMMAGAV